MKIYVIIKLFLVFSVTWMSVRAHAHPVKESLSLITYNPRSEVIEVAHRFGLHDAEYFTRAVLGRKTDLLTDKQSQKYFSAYVHEGFSIRAKNAKEYELEDIGVQLEGNYLWVYQELSLSVMTASLPTEPGSKSRVNWPDVIQVRNNILRDVWPEQRNVVNIDFGLQTHALVFEGEVQWLDYTFEFMKNK